MGKSPLLFGLIIPALMVLGGWWAYRAGHLDEFWFFYSALMPALVVVLGWGAVVLNEVAMRRERRRSSYGLRGTGQPSVHRARAVAAVEDGNRPSNNGSDRLVATVEVISLVLPWTGSAAHAVAWYRMRPLPGLDGQTAEQLVNQGRVELVKAHMARMAPADLL
jgi:hypothetical protein